MNFQRTYAVPALKCHTYSGIIELKIAEIDGVVTVRSYRDSRTLLVEWDEPPASWQHIREVLDSYDVDMSDYYEVES